MLGLKLIRVDKRGPRCDCTDFAWALGGLEVQTNRIIQANDKKISTLLIIDLVYGETTAQVIDVIHAQETSNVKIVALPWCQRVVPCFSSVYLQHTGLNPYK